MIDLANDTVTALETAVIDAAVIYLMIRLAMKQMRSLWSEKEKKKPWKWPWSA